MSKKPECILLVDDSEMDNFFHKVIIRKAGIAENVVVAENATQALKFLRDDSNPTPDLIFLDINMPGMNGWEFLDEYRNLDEKKKEKTVIIMLSTSLNPDDREKAGTVKEVKEYHSKPMTREMLLGIRERYF